MNARHSLWFALAAVLWLSAAGVSTAQQVDDERYHQPRPDDVRPPYDRDAIQRRLNDGRDVNEADQLLRKLLNLSDQDKENFARIVNDNPQLRNQLTQEILRNKELRDRLKDATKLPESDRKWLEDHVHATVPATQPPDPAAQPTKIGPLSPGAAPTEPTAEPQKPSSPPPSEPKEEPTGLRKLLARAGPQAMELFADLGLKEDGDFLRNILRGKMPAGNGGHLSQAVGRLTEVAKELPLDRLTSGEIGGAFSNWHMPSMPKLNLSFLRHDPSDTGAGGLSAPGDSGSGNGALFVWLLLALALAAFLRKGKELFRPSGTDAAGTWRPGAWPVRPESVRTRADLVRAFEYLAFLFLGLAARPRNHIDLAAALAATGDDPSRRTAAARLARLYERARYAPDDDALPEADLRSAQADLTYLAGVGPA